MYTLELYLKPLSELLFRQMAKSNVQWYTYPFIPPTSLAGFIVELMDMKKLEEKKYIEQNDGKFRSLPEGVFSLGAIPRHYEVNEHYRQHYRHKEVYNYESLVWKSYKKLARTQYFYTPLLFGYLISEERRKLEQIKVDVKYKINNIGKSGIIKVEKAEIKELTLQKNYKGAVTTLVPVEVAQKYNLEKVFETSIKCFSDSEEAVNWVLIPCSFGTEIDDSCYKGQGVVIPATFVQYIKNER